MRGNRSQLALVVTCGALGLTACAPAVRSDRDESIPVPQGATWAWESPAGPREPQRRSVPDTTGAEQPEPAREPRGPRYGMGGYGRDIPFDDAMFSQRFRRAAETAMQAKGFHKADDPSQAEFLLGYDLSGALVRRGGTSVVGVGVGLGGPYGMGMYPAPYRGNPREVRLVVLFKQRERGDVAWRASYIMDIYDMRESSQASVQRIADKVLRELR